MNKIHFVITIHNHQPDGNFDHVIKNALDQAYYPFLKTLAKHPSIKIALHHSGCLLEWLDMHHPAYLDLVSDLVEKNQIELLGGGFYEPILPLIPTRDRIGQLQLMSRWLKEHFNTDSRGIWIAERVWEQELTSLLHDTGARFTFLDDFHFKMAGLADEELYSHFITEDKGRTVHLYPISQFLRYSMPFRAPEDTIEYLRRRSGIEQNVVAVFADDGEKFGIWPETHHLCYREKWLERFFRVLEDNRDWIETILPSEGLHIPNAGRVYLPDSSYMEMMEWSLLPIGTMEREALFREYGPHNGRHMISGGFFRNFLVKYPESNQMHKKMLLVSKKVQIAIEKTEDEQEQLKILKELWRGQCNCAYWHGIFGGLYLKHLRNAVYRRLLSAERLAGIQLEDDEQRVTEVDYDCDGFREVLVSGTSANFYIAPADGGKIIELDYLPLGMNIVDILGRYREPYHYKLEKIERVGADDKVQSIHDQVRSKEEGLEGYLFYDRYRRGILVDHFFPEDISVDQIISEQYDELGDFTSGKYELESIEKGAGTVEISMTRDGHVRQNDQKLPVRVEKRIRIRAGRDSFEVLYNILNVSDVEVLSTLFGSEMCLSMIEGHSQDRYYIAETDRLGSIFLDSTGYVQSSGMMGLVDEQYKFTIRISSEPGTGWFRFPLETVSMSEDGFEKNYQGSVLIPVRRLELHPGERSSFSITFDIQGGYCKNA